MRVLFLAMSVVLAVSMVASPAYAGSFFDDYEGDPLGAAPVANTGSYVLTGGPVVSNAQAKNGTQSLYFAPGAAINALLNVPATAGETVHSEFWMYIVSTGPATPPDADANVRWVFGGLNNAPGVAIGGGGAGVESQLGSGRFQTPYGGVNWLEGNTSGGSSTADTWQKWELDYVVGATTIDLTIDGAQTTGHDAQNSPAAGIYNSTIVGQWLMTFQLRALQPGEDGNPDWYYIMDSEAYVDDLSITVTAVPEPSTVMLLFAGAALLGPCLVRRRRHWRTRRE